MSDEAAKFCIPFEESGVGDTDIVGGNNASLGELLRAGVNVPPGFSVSTAAYNAFFLRATLKADVQELLKEIVDCREQRKCEEASKKIQTLIKSFPMPEDIEDSIDGFAPIFAYLGPEGYRQERLREDNGNLTNRVRYRKKAQRRRLRTVMQDLIYMASRISFHARQMYLSFERYNPWAVVWQNLYRGFMNPVT